MPSESSRAIFSKVNLVDGPEFHSESMKSLSRSMFSTSSSSSQNNNESSTILLPSSSSQSKPNITTTRNNDRIVVVPPKVLLRRKPAVENNTEKDPPSPLIPQPPSSSKIIKKAIITENNFHRHKESVATPTSTPSLSTIVTTASPSPSPRRPRTANVNESSASINIIMNKQKPEPLSKTALTMKQPPPPKEEASSANFSSSTKSTTGEPIKAMMTNIPSNNNSKKVKIQTKPMEMLAEFSPVVGTGTASAAGGRKKSKSIITSSASASNHYSNPSPRSIGSASSSSEKKREKTTTTTTATATAPSARNYLRRMSSSLREKLTIKEQLEFDTTSQKELARCIPPKAKSLYQFELPSSVIRSMIVLQNNTLCRFGGLGQDWMHLVFLKVPVTEGTLPSNWELYTKACLENRVEPIEAIRRTLSITPGRYNLKQLHLGCSGFFEDVGVKTVLPLIYHNRHVIEDLQIQCSGLADEGLRMLIEALDDDEIPDQARDNLAISLHPICRMNKLTENGGRFADERFFEDSSGNGSQQQQQKKRSASRNSLDNNNNFNDNSQSLLLSPGSGTLTMSLGLDRSHHHQNTRSSMNNNSRNSDNNNKNNGSSSPNSRGGLGETMKMDKLRSAVYDVIRNGCVNLKRINLSCNLGITSDSTPMLCEFCEDHPKIIFVNVQQTKIDLTPLRRVLLSNRDKMLYEMKMKRKEKMMMGQENDDDDDYNFDGGEDDELNVRYEESISFGLEPSQQQQTDFFKTLTSSSGFGTVSTLLGKSNHQQQQPKSCSVIGSSRHHQTTSASASATTRAKSATQKVAHRRGGYLMSTESNNIRQYKQQHPGSSKEECRKAAKEQQQRDDQNSNDKLPLLSTTPSTLAMIKRGNDKASISNPSAPPSTTTPNSLQQQQQYHNKEHIKVIDYETFVNDVKMFETFMNPYSGLLELSRMSSQNPHLVSKISAHILAQRSKVEERVYNDTVKNASTGNNSSSSSHQHSFFTRSKLPLAHIPELSKELRMSAQQAAAEIDRNPALSLETVSFIVFLQAMHPACPLIEIERAIVKHCEFAHADSVTKAMSALESVPLSVTIECLQMFDALDAKKTGYVTLDDFLRISMSNEGKDAARFMFERYGLNRVKREEFIPLCIPFLTK